MPLPKPIRLLLYCSAGLLGLVLLLLVIVSLFRIPINLEGQKGIIESIAEDALERQVTIDGAIKVTTSLWPVFIIEDLHIKNPEGFADGDFVRLQSVRLSVGLIRLLLGKIRVKEFTVNGLELSLRVNENDAVNWVFKDEEDDEPEEEGEDEPGQEPERPDFELVSDSLIVDNLRLSNIAVSYFRPGMEKPNEFIIDTCEGSATPGKPFQATLNGSTLEEPYKVSIQAASLQELLEESRSWLEIETRIAQALLKLSGNVDLAEVNRSLKLKLEIKGEWLQNFNRLLRLNLPPFPSYGLNASLAAQKGLLELTDLKIHVSESILTGTMKVDNTGLIPEVELALQSPLIQINNFVFDSWSPFENDERPVEKVEETKAAGAEEKAKQEADRMQHAEKEVELLSPESLKRLNANITVSADKVLSGEDPLGNGQITASLKDGRISLDPLNLEVPGGSVSIKISAKPGRESAAGSLKVLVENFDFGVLARRAEPETNMGGIININIDLQSTAQDFSDLLAEGNGYFDFSAKPENLQAGIMDLWALNVISAIVSNAVKGESHIEYLVGRWTMKDGHLAADVFVIDTTRMRICGKGWADFKTEKVELEVAPAPKKPEFFSLATPISIQGDFEDFGLGIAPGGLIGTGIKFVVSPIQVPIQTVFSRPIPADAGDIKAIELGPENRDIKRPVGCRWFSTK